MIIVKITGSGQRGDDSVDAIIDRIGTSRRDIIPLLQALQDEFSYLPSDALLRVYERTEIDRAQLISVSTFYSQFRHVPYGKHIIKVCTGTACHVKGANNVYDAFRRELKMEEDRITTADQEYSIEKIACLGCCAWLRSCRSTRRFTGMYNRVGSMRYSMSSGYITKNMSGKRKAMLLVRSWGRSV